MDSEHNATLEPEPSEGYRDPPYGLPDIRLASTRARTEAPAKAG